MGDLVTHPHRTPTTATPKEHTMPATINRRDADRQGQPALQGEELMTPYETALFLMQRRVVDADFVVAYLLAEAAKAGYTDPLRLSDHPTDQIRYRWADLKAAFRPFVDAVKRLGGDVSQVDFVRAV